MHGLQHAAATTKENLDRLQRQALKICCRSLPGIPISSIQVECGQPALSLRRRRLQSDYAEKIQSDRDHPTTSIMKDCWAAGRTSTPRTGRTENRTTPKSRRSSTPSTLPTYLKYHSKQQCGSKVSPRIAEAIFRPIAEPMTNASLHKIGIRDKAVCAVCRTSMTTEHFLLTCPVSSPATASRRSAPRECIRIVRATSVDDRPSRRGR